MCVPTACVCFFVGLSLFSQGTVGRAKKIILVLYILALSIRSSIAPCTLVLGYLPTTTVANSSSETLVLFPPYTTWMVGCRNEQEDHHFPVLIPEWNPFLTVSE